MTMTRPIHCKWPTLDGPYRKAMARLGAWIGHRPLPFLILPVLVSLAFVYPFVQGLGDYRRLALTRAGALQLFTPSSSQSEHDRVLMSGSFPDGGYFRDRTAVSPGLFIIIASWKDRSDTVFDDRFVNEYRLLRNRIEDLSVTTMDGGMITIRSICQSPTANQSSIYEGCQSDPFLTLWTLHRSGLLPSITYPYVQFDSDHSQSLPSSMYIGPLFGGVKTDQGNNIQYVRYVRMIFRLPTIKDIDSVTIDRLAVAFGSYLDRYRSDILSIDYWVSTKYARDMQLISRRVVHLLPALIILLLTFALISCCMKDCVLSKPWLAVAGLGSAGIGLQVGFAVLFVIGVDLIEIAMIVPFLVLSIGLDDTFVMLNVWRSSDPGLSVEKRMSIVFEQAAVSITITSVTDVAAFLIGLSSVFPSVRIFCAFSASSLFAVFIFQLTFFGACMTYTGRAEANNRHCVTFRKVNPTAGDEESLVNKIFCTTTFADSKTVSSAVSRRPWPVTFFKTHFSSWLGRRWVKISVGLSYLIYIITSVSFLVFFLRRGLQVSSLVPYHSTTHNYLTLYERYFSACSTSAEVLILPSKPFDCNNESHRQRIDYSRRDIQQSLLDWSLSFEDTDYTFKIDFWLYEYLLYREDLADQRNVDDEGDRDEDFMHDLQVDFLPQDRYRKYIDHVIIDRCSESLVINATRFYVHLANMGFENRSAAMHLLRSKASTVPTGFTAYVYDVSFPLAEQYDAVLPGVIYDVAVGVGCMLLVACLFVPNLVTCVCIAFTVFSINIGVLGYMAVWGVNLDIISTITILLSIGFSVDYTSHVAYHFYVSGRGDHQATIETKVAEALETAGWPILQSSLSMMIGVVNVLGVRAYIADTFVKTVLLVMIIGVYHALIVLPVLLSLVSQSPTRSVSPSVAVSTVSSGRGKVSGRVTAEMVTTSSVSRRTPGDQTNRKYPDHSEADGWWTKVVPRLATTKETPVQGCTD